ncbi:alpha/beta hydrolase family esterase [Nocardia terpenica]|uniref:Esterase n=1 Tax=Nocardia terpenica TaxID=455432 RepID=A0A291RTG7_9NOCA|nr:hypothetical protein [Nocardia terpenica]ATL70803.1 hypothetical protein CRH09_36110 [Nocardia terpenica]
MADELVSGEVSIGGLARTFAVRPPRDREAPLVLLLHGHHPAITGRVMVDLTTFGRYADEWGIAVGYPDGYRGSWADGRGVTAADADGVDDVAFLRTVIEWCADRFDTLPDRTLVAGISNGAFMSHRLALEASDLVPVFAAVAGGLPTSLSELRPTHAVSALLINGTDDTTQPIEGGYSRWRGPNGELRGRTLGLIESAEHWRRLDQCDGPENTTATDQSSRHTATGGVGGTQVSAWTVFGGGHTWPGTPLPGEWGEAPGMATTMEFDAAVEIHRFAEPLLTAADTRKI